jgi:hypothetical protein
MHAPACLGEESSGARTLRKGSGSGSVAASIAVLFRMLRFFSSRSCYLNVERALASHHLRSATDHLISVSQTAQALDLSDPLKHWHQLSPPRSGHPIPPAPAHPSAHAPLPPAVAPVPAPRRVDAGAHGRRARERPRPRAEAQGRGARPEARVSRLCESSGGWLRSGERMTAWMTLLLLRPLLLLIPPLPPVPPPSPSPWGPLRHLPPPTTCPHPPHPHS